MGAVKCLVLNEKPDEVLSIIALIKSSNNGFDHFLQTAHDVPEINTSPVYIKMHTVHRLSSNSTVKLDVFDIPNFNVPVEIHYIIGAIKYHVRFNEALIDNLLSHLLSLFIVFIHDYIIYTRTNYILFVEHV